MEYDFVFRIIETILQLVLVIFAGFALFVWKKEIRGKDEYKLAKSLLSYIKELRFLIYSKGSMSQIYLNDILTDRENFYNFNLGLVCKEEVYFDESIWRLFNQINIRSDIFLPKQIRVLLKNLCPQFGEKISSDKNQYTYIRFANLEVPSMTENNKDFVNVIYQMPEMKELTIEEYFKIWEELIIELRKML